MRRAARVDANHTEIIATLRTLGWYVHDTSRLGGGFGDAVAARRGKLRMIEIKNGANAPSRRKLTPAEKKARAGFAEAGVEVHIITSTVEAEALR